VTVQGAVTAYGRSEGGEWLRLRGTHASDAGSLTVWVHANHGGGVRLARVKDADSIRVTGILVAFQDNPEDPLVWQIIPRTAPDVVMLGGRSWRVGGTRIGLAVIAALLVVLIAMRVGARRHATALRETEDRYRQLLELSPDAVIVHEGGRVRFANPAAAAMLGVDGEAALVGRDLSTFVDAESRTLFVVEAPAPATDGDAPQSPEPVRRARGRVRTCGGGELDVEVTTSPCRYHDRPATVVLARDITQELRVERDLRSLALLDDLTGLHNRRGFMLFAEQELARARRYGRETALVFADLDDLKAVNDEHGHAAGDLAIRAMANALRSVVRESDIVARWSGDEFVALLLESSAAHLPQFAERLRVALESQSLSLPFVVRASVGTAAIEDAIADALERADAALYQAKSEKRQA
jgi:diguanylate cyclase (GGDEF)-like protein/PAS domain S-box-containing protein